MVFTNFDASKAKENIRFLYFFGFKRKGNPMVFADFDAWKAKKTLRVLLFWLQK